MYLHATYEPLADGTSLGSILNLFWMLVCSGVLDQIPHHVKAQSFSGSLHPHPLPVVLGPGQQLFPERHVHEGGADR